MPPTAPTFKFVYDTIGGPETSRAGLAVIPIGEHDGKLLTTLPPLDAIAELNDAREFPAEYTNYYGAVSMFKQLSASFLRVLHGWLENGTFVPNIIEVAGGLNSVGKTIDRSKAGVSAVKLIIRNQE